MPLLMVEDIRLDAPTADMAQIEVTVPAVTCAQRFGQAMPLQRLLGMTKPPAFMHVVLAGK